jgi:hypothetical protein
LTLPPWEAVIVHVPPATVWTVDPDTVHTAGVLEVNDTASPGAADADKVTGTPAVAPAGGVKLIVCAACPVVTWSDVVAGVAAA